MHELVMNYQSRSVTYPKLTLQRQDREPCLRLSDHIDRLKPDGERQLGGFNNGSCRQGRLVAAVLALISLSTPGMNHTVVCALHLKNCCLRRVLPQLNCCRYGPCCRAVC